MNSFDIKSNRNGRKLSKTFLTLHMPRRLVPRGFESRLSPRLAKKTTAACSDSGHSRGSDNLTFAVLCTFVTATFLLGMYFLPVAVLLSGGVKQVATLPKHITLKGSLHDPIYGSIVYYIPFPC